MCLIVCRYFRKYKCAADFWKFCLWFFVGFGLMGFFGGGKAGFGLLGVVVRLAELGCEMKPLEFVVPLV